MVDLEKHDEVKRRLRDAGTSLAQVSRELGVKDSTVTTVSQGYRNSSRILEAIASRLNTTPGELWPARHGR